MEVFESVGLLKVMGALALVLSLAFILIYLGKKFGVFRDSKSHRHLKTRPLQLIDALALDPKRRLVVVEWAGEDHLILLGQHAETFIRSTPVPTPYTLQRPASAPKPMPVPSSQPLRTETSVAHEKRA